jgi:formylglycine-generating enzyme required for sulfatase activity
VAGLFLFSFIPAQNNGGFQKIPYLEQEIAPGMILIEGMIPADPEKYGLNSDTIQSFYISALEETNAQYCAYLSFIKKYYSTATYKKALPDTNLWMKESLPDSLEQYLAKNYLRHYIFRDYPVVGVSPEQIEKYAWWKTDRMNEMVLIREEILKFYEPADSIEIFTTIGYLNETFDPDKNKLPSLVPSKDRGERLVRMEDGIILPRYRMVIADEWKLAALAIGDTKHTYIVTPKEVSNKKSDKKNHFGHLYVKEKGIASNHYQIVSKLAAFNLRAVYTPPMNNYKVHGLYDNVSEWVADSNGKYSTMGGSWKIPGPSYATVYHPHRLETPMYDNPEPFVLPGKEQNKVSAATGFRLAMDHIGAIDPRIKRRKVK